MNKKRNILFGILIIIAITVFYNWKVDRNLQKKQENQIDNQASVNQADEDKSEEDHLLNSIYDIQLQDVDGAKKNYVFTYQEKEYHATYTPDNWHIENSYQIIYMKDIRIICQALIQEHPIHGKDMASYRTAEDMTYEWLQHNTAYRILSSDNPWKKHAKDVDLDPEDQGRNFKEIYEDRTGQKWSITNLN